MRLLRLAPIWAVMLAGCVPAESSVAEAKTPAATPIASPLGRVPEPKAANPRASTVPDVGEAGNVEYHNPKTGYSGDYVLDVEWSGDEVERINFSNGGWEDDFVDQTDNGDGTVTVTDEDGREFTVEKESDGDEEEEPVDDDSDSDDY